jgi:predicted  nucleic acid-binding Zn-ribbon protein
MSRETDVGGPVYVSNGDVQVEKSFVADEFPVPAIKFRIASDSQESAHVRIVDQIPDDFPMEGVGFHPDFESENWAAYKDHRVEYERTLEPNESVETVYGVRLDKLSEADSFLTEPVLERPPVPKEGDERDDDDGVEDILGEDRSQLVRDALQGNGNLGDPEADAAAAEDAAGAVLEAEADTGSDPLADPLDEAQADADDVPVDAVDETAPAEVQAAVEDGASAADIEAAFDDAEDGAAFDDAADEGAGPRDLSAETTPAITRSGEAEGEAADADAEADAAAVAETVSNVADDVDADADASETFEDDADEEIADAESAEADETVSDPDDYVDIGDSVADEDAVDAGDADATAAAAASGSLATALAAELRAGDVPEEDVELLRTELDFGLPRSADVRIRRLQAKMDDLQAYSDALAEFIDEEGTGQELVDGLRREVEALDEELDTFGDDLAAVEAGLDDAESDRADIRDDVSTLEGDLAALDERVEDTAQRLSDVDDRASEAVAGVEELNTTLDDQVEAVNEDIEELSEDLSQTASAAAGLDEELGEVREDIADLDGEIVSTRESLEDDVAAVRSDLDELDEVNARIESLEDDIEVLMQFRDRLNDAFGPGE